MQNNLPENEKNKKLHLSLAVGATTAVAINVALVIMNPSLARIATLVIWVVVSIIGWLKFFKLKAEIEKQEKS